MGVRERREREKDQLREKILDAARRLFVEQGFDAVSMRKIADVIEYSPTAIYLHFKDKESLIFEICRTDFGRMAAMTRELAAIKSPTERIRQMGIGYIRFAVQHPEHYRLMFMTPHKPAPPAEELQHKGDPDQDGYAALVMAVREAMRQKLFKPQYKNAEMLAQVFWAGVHGVASLQITYERDPWFDWTPLDDRIHTMVDALLNGMTRRPLPVARRKSSANRTRKAVTA